MASPIYDLIDDEFGVGNIVTKEKLFLLKVSSILGQEIQSKDPLTDQDSAKISAPPNLQL